MDTLADGVFIYFFQLLEFRGIGPREGTILEHWEKRVDVCAGYGLVLMICSVGLQSSHFDFNFPLSN